MRIPFLLRTISIALIGSLLGGSVWFVVSAEQGISAYSVTEHILPVSQAQPAVVRSIPRLHKEIPNKELVTTKTSPSIPRMIETQAALPISTNQISTSSLTTTQESTFVAPVGEASIQHNTPPTLVLAKETSTNTKEIPVKKEDPISRTIFGNHELYPNPTEAPALAEALRSRIPQLTIKEEQRVSAADITWRLAQLEHILRFFPESHVASLRYLTLDMSNDGPRGLGGAQTIIVRGTNMSDAEFASVFIHELGHIVDLGYLTPTQSGADTNFMDGHIPVGLDDPSRMFYSISWSDTKTQHHGSTAQDFITGYAKTDPFEDFAESFIFYILHGNTFRQLATGNSILQEKYEFLRKYVFEKKEFETGQITVTTAERTWDSTKLPVQKIISPI